MTLARGPGHILPKVLSLPDPQFFVPAACRGIVVGASVYDSVGRVVMGQVGVIQFAVERELENPHSWQPELITERGYVLCDQPQILGDEWQRAQLLLNRTEEISARTGDPLTR